MRQCPKSLSQEPSEHGAVQFNSQTNPYFPSTHEEQLLSLVQEIQLLGHFCGHETSILTRKTANTTDIPAIFTAIFMLAKTKRFSY